MRLLKFLEENVVQDALAVDEPEVGGKYDDDMINKRLDLIQKAIKELRGKEMDDDAKEAMMADLNDKLDKWENVEQEIKPTKPAAKKPEGEKPEDLKKDLDAKAGDRKKEREEKSKEKTAEREKETEKTHKDNQKRTEMKKKAAEKTEGRLIKSRIRLKLQSGKSD